MNAVDAPGGAERVLADQLLRDRMTPLLAHLIALGLVFVLVYDTVPRQVSALWGIAVASTVVIRAVAWAQAARHQLPAAAVSRIARSTMVAVGLAWGGGIAFAAPFLSPDTLALILLAIAGLVAASAVTLAPDRWAFPLYTTALFGPALTGLALEAGSRTDAVTIALIVVFAGFTARLHARSYATLLQLHRGAAELREALDEIQMLRGYLRVCANCRRVLAEDGQWEQLEAYVRRHTGAEFSHGICPDCARSWK